MDDDRLAGGHCADVPAFEIVAAFGLGDYSAVDGGGVVDVLQHVRQLVFDDTIGHVGVAVIGNLDGEDVDAAGFLRRSACPFDIEARGTGHGAINGD